MMEADNVLSDSENVVANGDDKTVLVSGAGDAAQTPTDRLKRKGKKFNRSNSKDAVASTPLPKYRNWKNSRRPRNGHGRGLPKKGKPSNPSLTPILTSFML